MPPAIRTQTKAPRLEFPIASFLLYGEPKVGKTITAAQFPGSLILNVLSENGTTQIEGDVVDISTPAQLQEAVRWLKAGQHSYQSVTLDGVSTFCMDAVARSDSRDTRRAVKDATNDLRPVLHEFLALPMIRVITGHARRDEEEIKIDGRSAVKVTIYPDLPPRLRLFIEGRVDAFGYCFASKGRSLVWWLPLDTLGPPARTVAAGNRLGLPSNTELSFAAIRAALVSSNGHKPGGGDEKQSE
jgi:hypothetical protein